MKKLIPLIVVMLTATIFAGCGGSGGGGGSPTGVVAGGSTGAPLQGSPEDRAAVAAEAALHPEFMDDAVYASGVTMSSQVAGSGGTFSTETAITPITFSRKFRVTDSSFEYAFADTDSTGRPTSAILTVHRVLTGTFRIQAADTSGGFNDPVRITKPLSETWTRRLQFVRVSNGGNGDGKDDDDDDKDDDARLGRNATEGHGHGHKRDRVRWELVAVSGIEIASATGETDIVSLQFEASGLDTTITDALQLRAVGSLPALTPGTLVTVTATTNAADDIVLLVSLDRRVRLHANGDNSYTGTFTVPRSLGSQHFGVNALSHETLYDDTAAYDSKTWLLPMRAGRAL